MDTDGANALIGERLERLRRSNRYSRERLFELTGVPAITIRRIETGQRSAAVPVLAVLTRALGVPVADFLNSIQKELDEIADRDAGQVGE